MHDAKVVSQNAIKKVPTTAPKVAITFDDGPHPFTTLKLLASLKEKNAKATFFILGKNAEAYPELLHQISIDGHELGNHTYSHQRLTRLSQDGIRAELQHTNAIITNITGQTPHIVRPPDNGYNNTIVQLTQEMGYKFVLWSIDTRDWTNVSPATILERIEKTKPGDIILFHDGVVPSQTAAALPLVIDALHAKGYHLVTISELLQTP
jgi:peptidoglycan/xylan/chitin deacetylase (PgdA/CDA1 family)